MRKGYLLTAILLFTAALVLGGLLTLTGSTWGWRSWSGSIIDGRVNTAAPWSMMNGGIMNGTMMNAGMMGGGLMNGAMINGGMMGAGDGTAAGEPLTLAEARQAVSDYLTARGDNGALEIGEIMIFSNHAYAQIIDADTGRGAFEVLIDPRTQAVFPEPGPTHMWNTDYGMLAGGNMMGGMMNGGMMAISRINPAAAPSISAEDAVAIGGRYLDARGGGLTADDHADAFPGYYTLHVNKEGQVSSMLSVNAYTGQVFYHHWHGDFIEMSAVDH